MEVRKWSNTWADQFKVLLERGFKERRHEAFSGLKISQVFAVSVMCGCLWWRSSIAHVQDQVSPNLFILTNYCAWFEYVSAYSFQLYVGNKTCNHIHNVSVSSSSLLHLVAFSWLRCNFAKKKNKKYFQRPENMLNASWDRVDVMLCLMISFTGNYSQHGMSAYTRTTDCLFSHSIAARWDYCFSFQHFGDFTLWWMQFLHSPKSAICCWRKGPQACTDSVPTFGLASSAIYRWSSPCQLRLLWSRTGWGVWRIALSVSCSLFWWFFTMRSSLRYALWILHDLIHWNLCCNICYPSICW